MLDDKKVIILYLKY